MHSSAGFSSNPAKIPTKERENTQRIMNGPGGGLGGMASSTQTSQNIGHQPHQHSGGASAANNQDFSLK